MARTYTVRITTHSRSKAISSQCSNSLAETEKSDYRDKFVRLRRPGCDGNVRSLFYSVSEELPAVAGSIERV